MKKRKQLSIAAALLLSISANAQWTAVSTTTDCPTCSPTTQNNVVLVPGSPAYQRVGHETVSGIFGTYATGNNEAWSSIGVPNIFAGTGSPLKPLVPANTNLYGYMAQWESDRAFFGLRRDADDNANAIIAWGDNPSSFGPDRLIFSFYTGGSTSMNNPGTELATLFPNGNFGIGSAFQPTTPPHRRLDVFQVDSPQLRLTQTQNSSISSGTFTDFQTTSLGDLYINPILNFLNQKFSRNVGIGVSTPSQKLDVAGGTARLRVMPSSVGSVLVTGIQNALGDYTLSYSAYPNDPTKVLLGNGTWGAVPGSAITASNGLMISPASNVRWGQTPGTSGNPATLLGNTEIPMDDKNITFVDNASTGSQSLIGIGTSTPASKLHIVRGNFQDSPNPSGLIIDNSDLAQGSTSSSFGAQINVTGSNYNNSGLVITSTTNNTNANAAVGISTYAVSTGSTNTNNSAIGGSFSANSALQTVGISAIANGNANSSSNPGNSSYGGRFFASGNAANTGVWSQATGAGVGQTNYGGYFVAVGTATTSYGGFFAAAGTATNYYGIYAGATTSSLTSYAGFFNGNVYVSGTTSGVGYLVASDQKFKKDITTVKNGLEIIRNINAAKYNYDKEGYKMMNFPETSQYGFIAQNLEKYAPELVADQIIPTQYDREGNKTSDEVKFKAVNYIQMIPLLTSAVQELDTKIGTSSKQLETELADLKAKYNQLSDLLNEICSNGCDNLRTPTTGATKATSLLFQNVPNPFTNSTVINYSIAEGATSAEMLLADMNGRPIQKISLELTKHGTLAVPSDNLSTGVITYSLIVDGKLVDTKKMVLAGK